MSLRPVSFACMAVIAAALAAGAPDVSAQIATEENPTARQPQPGSTSPTDHPFPKGAASVNTGDHTNENASYWWAWAAGIGAFVVAVAVWMSVAARQRREGAESQIHRT